MRNTAKNSADIASMTVLFCLLVAGLLMCFLTGAPDDSYPLQEGSEQERCETSFCLDDFLKNQRFDPEEYELCVRYNDALFREQNGEILTAADLDILSSYPDRLDFGAMACLVIPDVNVCVPAFAGTTDEVLLEGTGHMTSSSLPVGGINTHAVFAGHSGRLGADGFDRVDTMEPGDKFCVVCMGHKMLYRVDEIRVVEPDETDRLRVTEGQDTVTLITCTPVGVNSHRLLIRGVRIR